MLGVKQNYVNKNQHFCEFTGMATQMNKSVFVHLSKISAVIEVLCYIFITLLVERLLCTRDKNTIQQNSGLI